MKPYSLPSLLVPCLLTVLQPLAAQESQLPEEIQKANAGIKAGPNDCPQMLGSSLRNAVTNQTGIPITFDVSSGENVLWMAELGSETYGNPVIANGKVFIGTNNENAYLERLPAEVDLGVLLCVSEKDGQFLWQHSSEKLEEGRFYDWPQQGVCSTPMVDGDRLWFVNNRAEVICLDTEGFHDGENDGEKNEPNENPNEADVVWSLDMMKELGVSQLYMATCSITGAGDKLFVTTSNGTGEDGEVRNPEAPSLICVDRNTGKVLWQDNSQGENILHGQWSSPAFANLGGVDQVIFGGGDGWIYSFDAAGENGKSKLLWKFDCNPKAAEYVEGGGGSRFYIIGTPVIYQGHVFIGLGDDPEYADGQGILWCIDPTKRGDVSPTLVTNPKYDGPIPHRRQQALIADEGDVEKPNPNSAVVWKYTGSNPDEFEKTMHLTIGSTAIKDDILVVSDFSGVVHCLDSKTGKDYWTYDMFAASWGSPIIAGEYIYAADQDGDIAIFNFSKEFELVDELNVECAIATSPVVANSTLYIGGRNRLIAIQEGAQAKVDE